MTSTIPPTSTRSGDNPLPVDVISVAGEPAGRTHQVINQVPELRGINWYAQDPVLVEGIRRYADPWVHEHLMDLGAVLDGEPLEWGRQANENPPVLNSHDRWGRRANSVQFHPSYHHLMRLSLEAGMGGAPWADSRATPHMAHAGLMSLVGHADAGHACPVSATHGAIGVLRQQPDVAAQWEAQLTTPSYDPRDIAPADKGALTCAVGMTEKQGGSDIRANTTTATPVGRGGPGAEYVLRGHKWFFSAPMCDFALFVAQTTEGVSCFLVPRRLPDGSLNGYRLMRLKDKLGNRSNASSEIEFDNALGHLIGEPGRSVPTIAAMVNPTRLDCLLGSALSMRAGSMRALHHAEHRRAFGKRLAAQPLMRNVLADLAVESEAATILAMRVAAAYERSTASSRSAGGMAESPHVGIDEHEALLSRISIPLAKYWLCKRAPRHSFEVLEAHGGNGYVEESGIPMIYREAPLMSVWEGTGNVICLDVLRAMATEPGVVAAYFAEVEQARGADRRLDAAIDAVRAELSSDVDMQAGARRVVERMALALQGSLVVRHADPAVAEAFLASRLDRHSGHEYGTLAAGLDLQRIIDRHTPRLDPTGRTDTPAPGRAAVGVTAAEAGSGDSAVPDSAAVAAAAVGA